MATSSIEMPFPSKGLDDAFPVSTPPQLTSGDLLNVRATDTLASRSRGGQRPALVRWGGKVQIAGTQPIVAVCVIDSIK